MIFSDDPEKRYDDYAETDITSTDDNIGIKYTNENIVGDTVLLLRYNCPDASCDYAALGWPDLHRHVRTEHRKRMCDLCTRNKKLFTHEHDLFQDKELEKHMRKGDDMPGDVNQTGFRGHPLCAFCGQRFYDDDKLYEHCRMKHERCFICDRRDSRQPHYFLDYEHLEKHFANDHFLCLDKDCLEKKFVVFESEMDLKAHQLSEHAGSLSKDVRRDARVVDMSSFDFRPSYQQEMRGGRGRGRGRGRDPTADPLPASSAQTMRRDEMAFHRQNQLAIHSTPTQRTFGGQLTREAPARPRSANEGPSGGASASTAAPGPPSSMLDTAAAQTQDPATMTPQELARLARHHSVIERATNMAGNDTRKMAQFRQEVSSYKSGKLTGSKLIDNFFALFTNTSSNALGILVRELADLFEDPTKASDLRRAWQDWRSINDDYPSLPGLGGMRGATTASSGWATAAAASPQSPIATTSQQHTTRVLRLKKSTRQNSFSSTGSGSSTWTAAPAIRPPPSSSFPSLPTNAPAASSSSSRPSWVGSSASTSRAVPSRAPVLGKKEEAFPALPAAPKPQTTIFGYGRGAVRRDLGGNRDTGFSWGGQGGQSSANEEREEEEQEGKGKKKGKKKVLVAWG